MITSESVDMSFGDDFQELRFSDDMKKLDDFSLFATESSQEMNQIFLQAEPKYNVRKSLAWDSAFSTSPGVLEPEVLFQSVNSDIFGSEDEILLPSGSLEPHMKSRSDRCDLRKSLAWDDAFFTNAGVLDAEELAIINRGFKKSEAHLPGIEEDVSLSTESSFSIDSGNSSLTSLEIDLFEDMTESRNKSTYKLPNSVSSVELRRQKASNKLDACSQTRMNRPALRRKNINPNVEERYTMKTPSSAPSERRLAAGSTLSSLKPPRSAEQFRNTSAVSTKKASCSPNFARVQTPKAASGESCLADPKKISLRNGFPRCPTPTPTSSSIGFSPTVKKLNSGSLTNSEPVLKTPMKHSIRNKSKQESFHHSSHEFRGTNLSDCSSPDSHTDGWSLESSSAFKTQRSKNPKALKATMSGHVSFEDVSVQNSALSQNLRNQFLTQARLERRSTNRNNKTPLRTVSFPSRMSRNTKPSDLRVPLPKHGYFDEEISSVTKADRSAEFRSTKQIAVVNSLQSASQVIHKESTLVEEVPRNQTPARATIQICFPVTHNAENDSAQRESCKDCLGIKKPKCEVQEGSIENKIGTNHKEIIVVQRGKKRILEEHEKKMHFRGNSLRVLNDNKENVYSFEDQMEGLSKQVERIDLGGGVVIELKVSNNYSDSESAVLTFIL